MELIKTFWPIAFTFATTLIWLVRLEARGVENAKEIRRLWNQRREDLDMAKQARDETNKMLGEIRDDIKSLIAKVGGK
jgi:hypothetical protein